MTVPLHDISRCASRGAAARQHALARRAAQAQPTGGHSAPGRHTRRLPPLSGCLCPGRRCSGAAAAVPAVRSVSPLSRQRRCTATRRCWRIQPQNTAYSGACCRSPDAARFQRPQSGAAWPAVRRCSTCRQAKRVPRPLVRPDSHSTAPAVHARVLTRADTGAAPPAALSRLSELANVCWLRRPGMAAPSSCWKRCLRAPPPPPQPQDAAPLLSSRLHTLNKRNAATCRADTSCGLPPPASWCGNGARENSDGHNRRRCPPFPPPPHRAAASACREVRTPGGRVCAPLRLRRVLLFWRLAPRCCIWRAARRTRGPCGARSSRCYIIITRRRG